MSRFPSSTSAVDGYNYYISQDSDEEDNPLNSSDEENNLDEVEIFLHGTPKQKKRALQKISGEEISSSEDEFEKAMDKELNHNVLKLENSWLAPGEAKTSSNVDGSAKGKNTTDRGCYDQVYFDSDEETTGPDNKTKKHKIISNDDLLYDPFADDEDQKWVDRQRLRGSSHAVGKNKNQKPAGTDAVLSCPACMVTLCMNCQRHEKYHNQYRAMFVLNCQVESSREVHYPEPVKRTFKRHKRRMKDTEKTETISDIAQTSSDTSGKPEDKFHPVRCSSCNTEVAVYDHDEVYHFYNVLVGHA